MKNFSLSYYKAQNEFDHGSLISLDLLTSLRKKCLYLE